MTLIRRELNLLGFHRPPRKSVIGMMALVAAIGTFHGVARAQQEQSAPATTQPEKPKQRAAKEPETLKEPEDVSLKTLDGVVLRATYYPGMDGKKSTTLILVHAYKGKRSDYSELAKYLQINRFAVMVPDLRGHGESTRLLSGGNIDAASLQKADFAAMVTYDMEAVKSFLLKQHNEGQLNIDKLGVVGAEMGATVGLAWAALDWSWPLTTRGKQGQDVKALVLLSPEWTFKGLRINDALANEYVRRDLAILILVGKGSSGAVQQANRIHSAFKAAHPEPPPGTGGKKDLFLLRLPTSLQGTKLLGENLKVEDMITKFIQARLASLPLDWEERKKLD